MRGLNKVTYPLLSFLATVLLTVLAIPLGLDANTSYSVFATGTSIALALALLEQRFRTDFGRARREIAQQLRNKLELYRLLDEIEDDDLKANVLTLARQLGSGELPPHISAVRIPLLYERNWHRIYASYVSPTAEGLCKWMTVPRFRELLELNRRRIRDGVKITRTFVLSRSQIIGDNGRWHPLPVEVLRSQVDAGIEVRVIWLEDLRLDSVAPTRRLDRNFTIFDDQEGVDTTDVQQIYRHPSKRLKELVDVRTEQIKYSEKFTHLGDAP